MSSHSCHTMQKAVVTLVRFRKQVVTEIYREFINEHHSFYPRENVYVTNSAPRLKAHRGTTPETLEELQDDEDAASASRYRK